MRERSSYHCTMRKTHSEPSAAFLKARYAPLWSIVGASTSRRRLWSGAYMSSACPVDTLRRHQESAVCATPLYRSLRYVPAGGTCGTPQYTMSSFPGAHTHFSAMVCTGKVTGEASAFTRAKREMPEPVDIP